MYLQSNQSSQPNRSYGSSSYSSKQSSKRAYFGPQNQTMLVKTIGQQSSQFSFSKNLLDTGKISIREDLTKLPKQDLIQILLQQIQESKILRIKLSTMQEQNRHFGISMPAHNDSLENNTSQFVSMEKYQELSQYMEEYISNTNQAQIYFTNLIKELKGEINGLREDNEELKKELIEREEKGGDGGKEDKQKIGELEEIIRNLEDTVTNYININNQGTRKYQKLKKMYQMLQQQLQVALQSYRPHDKSMIEPLHESQKQNIFQKSRQLSPAPSKDELQHKQQIKILQIQNNQLKQNCFALQKTLQIKSDKIRKLLQEMEKLSQQKWIYKQKYMQLKSKSYLLTSASSKNSMYEGCSVGQVDIAVEDYSSIK